MKIFLIMWEGGLEEVIQNDCLSVKRIKAYDKHLNYQISLLFSKETNTQLSEAVCIRVFF